MKTKHVLFAEVRITYHDLLVISVIVSNLERWEAAEKLSIKVGTLNHELSFLYKKLAVKNAQALINKARDNGFNSRGRYKNRTLRFPKKKQV